MVRFRLPMLIALAGVVGLAPVTRAESNGTPALSGKQIYQNACQRCHGVDGQGNGQDVVGFDVPLPDFSECNFNSREPAADWVAVAHGGGPARAFDRFMPAFGRALSEEQLEAAVDHIKDFCDERDHWPPGSLNLPRGFFTTKAFVEDEMVFATIAKVGDNHEVKSSVIFETRVGSRGQVEFILPFVFQEREDAPGDWTGGNGDIKLAAKWIALHSDRTGSILSPGLELVTPTGRVDRGTGKEVVIFEPFLAYGQLLPLDSFVQIQVGAEVSTDTDKAMHEAFWRLAAGVTFNSGGGFGRAWSPMVEVLGGMELEVGATPQWEVAPQLQVSLPTRQHILLSVGALIPVNDFDAGNIAAMVYLLWDWFDGPFTEGWR